LSQRWCGLGQHGPAPHQRGNRIGVHRAGIEVALSRKAAHRREHFRLLDMLDPFGNHLDAQLGGNADHAFDDDLAGPVGNEAIDEGLVDLDEIDRHGHQVGERGKAGAEIVERDFQSRARSSATERRITPASSSM
jgi:hypothetical protein